MHCKVVRSLFPANLLSGNPPKMPVASFFLLGLEGKQRMAMALVIYALYTLHNELRHTSAGITPQDFRKSVYRVVAEVDLHHAFKEAWHEILQWESAGFSFARRGRPATPHIQT